MRLFWGAYFISFLKRTQARLWIALLKKKKQTNKQKQKQKTCLIVPVLKTLRSSRNGGGGTNRYCVGHRFSHPGISGEKKIGKNMESLDERLQFAPKLGGMRMQFLDRLPQWEPFQKQLLTIEFLTLKTLKGRYADHILIPYSSTGSSSFFDIKWKPIFF